MKLILKLELSCNTHIVIQDLGHIVNVKLLGFVDSDDIILAYRSMNRLAIRLDNAAITTHNKYLLFSDDDGCVIICSES